MKDLKFTITGIVVYFYIGIASLLAQSKAHEYSKFAIVDPAYDSKKLFPKSSLDERSDTWIYGASELECWRLQLLQQRKDSARLNVGYPGMFHKPYTAGSFRLRLGNPITLKAIRFRAAGQGEVHINNQLIASFDQSEALQTINLVKATKVNEIQFSIHASVKPIALLIEQKELSTSQKNWEWRSDGVDWEPAYHHPQNLQKIPPHSLDEPTITLKPISAYDHLYDFEKELFGFILIRSAEQPVISVGESIKEARDINNEIKEQSLEMVNSSPGIWRSKTPLAFRYLFTEGKQIGDISCKAYFHPTAYTGAFACSDSTLTKIWMNSAYTLRLCMHDFLIDGIKRDRLPWAGDLTASLLANAYTFSDPELVRRSLISLGRAGIKEKDINGIIDYSLWWIIAQDFYQLYFGDPTHLSLEWHRIKETLNDLSLRCDEQGFLDPEESWLFIDWADQEKWTALQILWWWAQKSGVKLAHRIGDQETADQLTETSQALKSALIESAWNWQEKVWLSKNDPSSRKTRHPNFFAVLSGITPINQCSGIKTLLEGDAVDKVGTPYMAGFEMMALAQLGNIDYILNNTRNYWGAMLDKGATTFWEAYNDDETEENQYSFYGRPYAKSLCHAWSSVPAAFLSSEIFGLKPLDDGWKQFTLKPKLGHLQWASVCLPTKYGNIMVNVKKHNIQISIPKGTTLQWKNNAFEGPRSLRDKL